MGLKKTHKKRRSSDLKLGSSPQRSLLENLAPAGLFAALALLLGCSSAAVPTKVASETPGEGWASPLRADHALVGRIWESATGRFLSAAELTAQLGTQRYVLLGEKHDNPDHHALQWQTVQAVGEGGAAPGLVWEMLPRGIDPRLQTLGSRHFDSDEQLASYLEWDIRGWNWEAYRELVWGSYQLRLPMLAGNISRSEISALYASDANDSPAALGPEARERLLSDIDTSHCGMLPESQFSAMLRVQQGRDESMAQALHRLSDVAQPAVLIAGNYHVRHDLGVPNYLLARDAELRRSQISVVAFIEVVAGEETASDYLEQSDSIASADYLWFTPAISDKDYCAGLRGEAQ